MAKEGGGTGARGVAGRLRGLFSRKGKAAPAGAAAAAAFKRRSSAFGGDAPADEADSDEERERAAAKAARRAAREAAAAAAKDWARARPRREAVERAQLLHRVHERLWRAELRAAFAVVDVDDSGEVDEVEFRWLLRGPAVAAAVPCRTAAEADELFRVVDKDGSGAVGLDELTAWLAFEFRHAARQKREVRRRRHKASSSLLAAAAT